MKETVLIVENQKIKDKDLAGLLKSRYELISVENGKEALDFLKDESVKISAIILEAATPQIDENNFFKKYRECSEDEKIPVLVIADKSEELEAQYLELGASDFIYKQGDTHVLVKRIDNLISRKELIDDLRDSERTTLTGAYNRKTFYRKAIEIMDNNPDEKYEIIVSDIEKFKYFNDAFGWKTGDKLLKFFVDNLFNVFKDKEVLIAHAHSDVFYFLGKQSDNIINDIKKVANMTYREFFEAKLSIKYGVYKIEDRSIVINAMCDNALYACNQAKLIYNRDIYVYDDTLRKKNLKKIQITKTMKTSLLNKDFKVYYQPKYDINTKKMIGAEALVRWEHPDMGMVSPGEFIPIFEENGFITELDVYVWEHVCEFMEEMRNKSGKVIPISVNISRKDIYKSGLPEILMSMVRRHNIDPTYLHLEITESAYMENTDNLLDVVKRFKEYGFIVEMDDFGSGYSSLNILAELPIDIIKLDMKFIQNEHINKNSHNIMTSIVNLAKWMNLLIIVEGAETEEQVKYLKVLNCNFVQGFFFSKPIKEEIFANKIVQEEITPIYDFESYRNYQNTLEQQQGSDVEMIVIVDAMQRNREILKSYLDTEYRFVEFEKEEEAYDFIEKNYYNIALVTMDTNLNNKDIFYLLKQIKKNEVCDDIPVLVTTSETDGEYADIAMEEGADAIVFKPYDKNEINLVVNNLFENHRKKVKNKLREIENQVKLDNMTGLLNRKEFERQVRLLLNKPGKEGVFLMLDIDNFKGINDSLGHLIGDQAIINMGNMLKSFFSEENLVCRLGGDEFAIFICHAIPENEIRDVLEKIREKLRIQVGDMEVSYSIGVSLFPDTATDYRNLYKCADKALILAKKLGKNQCRIYSDDQQELLGIDIRNMGWLIDESHESIFICDEKDHQILYINQAARNELLKDRREEVIGKKCYETIWGYKGPCEKCIKLQGEESVEGEIVNASNGKIYNVVSRRVAWSGGYARINFANDITEAVNNTLKIREMNENVKFGLEEEKFIYWNVNPKTNACALGKAAVHALDVSEVDIQYPDNFVEHVILPEDTDKFIDSYKKTKEKRVNTSVTVKCVDIDGRYREAIISHIMLKDELEQRYKIFGILNYID